MNSVEASMKVLYISSTHAGMHQSSIYFDLMQTFVEMGHEVTIAYAREKRLKLPSALYHEHGIRYLGIKTGNISKNKNVIEKGISILTIDGFFAKNLKQYLHGESFDLVLYSTPPITFIKTLKYLKKMSPHAIIYLMLKDIFPQNAVDIGLMSEGGILHKFFKRKERTLYSLVDYIGVMSLENKNYILKQEPYLEGRVEILPNAIKVKDFPITMTRDDFGLPQDKTLLLYGGNLGKPQSIPFIVKCIDALKDRDDIFFVIAGSGAHEALLTAYVQEQKPKHFKYLGQLNSEAYNQLTHLCDVGLIFLDYRFKIPNYPQRLLSYLQAKKPIICATDPNTDIGTIAQENGYGLRVMSNDSVSFVDAVNLLVTHPTLRIEMGQKGYEYMLKHYTVETAYSTLYNRVCVLKGEDS